MITDEQIAEHLRPQMRFRIEVYELDVEGRPELTSLKEPKSLMLAEVQAKALLRDGASSAIIQLIKD